MITEEQRKKQTSWDKLKSDHKKMARYQAWWRQYLSRKKKVLTPKKSVYDGAIRYNGVIYNSVTDLLLTDLQDDEILHIWKQLKAKIKAVGKKEV